MALFQNLHFKTAKQCSQMCFLNQENLYQQSIEMRHGPNVLTVKTDKPYLNILRYIILNILRYCVFIHNISIFGSFPYLYIPLGYKVSSL